VSTLRLFEKPLRVYAMTYLNRKKTPGFIMDEV
jgi:hypothetical protein